MVLKDKDKEIIKKIASYVLPFIIIFSLVLILLIPIKPKKFQPKDVLVFKTFGAAERACETYQALNYTVKDNIRIASLDNRIVYWIGLETDREYPMYLVLYKSTLSQYVILVRCDYPGTIFPVTCEISTFEGDREKITITPGRVTVIYEYKGRYLDKISAVCYHE